MLVMDRRGRARQIEDLIHLNVERECHIVAHQFETLVTYQVLDIALGPSKKIVETDNVMPIFNETVAQMRTKKSGAAGNEG
jgi:hypothetical protein